MPYLKQTNTLQCVCTSQLSNELELLIGIIIIWGSVMVKSSLNRINFRLTRSGKMLYNTKIANEMSLKISHKLVIWQV